MHQLSFITSKTKRAPYKAVMVKVTCPACDHTWHRQASRVRMKVHSFCPLCRQPFFTIIEARKE